MVLTASLLPFVPGQAVQADPTPSEPAGPTNDTPAALERPDEASARVAARIANRRVEVTGLRTETITVFANPDGTLTQEQTVRPTRVQKSDGTWTPVDTNLTVGSDGRVQPGATTVGLRFSNGGTAPLAEISENGKSVALSWPTALPTPTIDGNTATYAEVLPGVDLQVSADVSGFSEVLVVKTEQAAASPALAELRLNLAATGVTVTADAGGNLQAKDSAGNPVFVAGAPRMWDSSAGATAQGLTTQDGTPNDAPREAPVGVEVSGGQIALTPDQDLLTGVDTVFPVYIDPGFTSARIDWTMINSAAPTTSYWNHSGHAISGRNSLNAIYRSFFVMNTSGLQGKKIVSATFKTQLMYVSSCTATPVEVWRTGGIGTGTTWANSPGMLSKLDTITTAKGAPACPAGPVDFNIATGLQEVADANGSVMYLGLRATDETTWTPYKQFANNPTISVTYNTIPSGPAGFSINPCYAQCSSPVLVNDTRPTMRARVTDPDPGQNVRMDFEVYQGASLVRSGSSGWGSSGQILEWRVPTALAVGTTYTVRTRGYDGTSYGAWSTSPSFSIDTTAPDAATVSSTDYPAAAWSKDAGQSGIFTLSAAGTSDLAGFAYGLDENPPLSDVRTTTTANVTITPPTDGPHSLWVQAIDKAGNRGPLTEYQFNVGQGAVTTPTIGALSAGKTALTAVAPSTVTGVTYQWRRANADVWVDIPVADVSVAAGGGAVTWPLARSGADFPKLNWDVAATVNAAETGDEALDGPLQVRITFSGTAGDSDSVTFTLDRNMGAASDSGVGPGSVNLITGNLGVSASDFSAASFNSDLTVGRTFNTRESSTVDSTGMFGPGWVSSATVDSAASYTNLTAVGSLVQVGLPNGDTIGFTKNPDNSYTPQTGLQNLTLTYTSGTDTYTLAEEAGAVVTFTKVTGSGIYTPASVTTPGAGHTTTLSWETATVDGRTVTRPTRMLAPTPAGVTCGAGTAGLVRGCRALSFTYATTTTATASQPGDYTGRVKEISFTAWDPDATPAAMRTIVVASYAYNVDGRLVQAWDPRLDYDDGGITKHLAKTYAYDVDGILSTITPIAEEPWQLSYTTVPGDSGKGRLAQVTRSALAAGEAKATVVYRVPLTGTGAPYDLSATQARRWGQYEPPVEGAAVFGPDQVPDGNQSTGTPPSSYERAILTYMDANGQTVNTVQPGGHITATWYNTNGSQTRELAAGNRARALNASDTDDAPTEAALAATLSTLNIYGANDGRLYDTFGPEHDTAVRDGSGNWTIARARQHTDYTYDEGAPPGGPYGMVTTQIVGARVAGASTDVDTRTTKTSYDWTQFLPTAVTQDPAGLNLTTRTTYDATGLELTNTIPAGGASTNTPRTRKTTYYSTTANAIYPECGNRPEWANKPCRVETGGAPSAGEVIPAAVTTYDMYGQERVITEKNPSSGVVLRTTTTSYDIAGRVTLKTIVGAANTGEPLPGTKTIYDPASGRITRTQSVDSGGIVLSELISVFDSLGRITSYTDADGNVSTTTYDQSSRPITMNDGKGTQTFTHDGGSERRGLITQVADSQAGTFSATYNSEASIATQTLPNGLVATTTYNETNQPTNVVYAPSGCASENCVYFSDMVTLTIHAQPATSSSTLSPQSNTYDAIGRLTQVSDTFGAGCTTRSYSYDASTNRTAMSAFGPTSTGACQTTTPTSSRTWTYDTADRITSTGYAYDFLGRTTTIPAADTQTSSGGNLTSTYHVSDLVRTISQGGRTTTYSLDVNQARIRSWTDLTGGTTTSRRHHYRDESDRPAWTDEGSSAWTRNINSITGQLGAAYSSSTGATTFYIVNLHGDLVATTASDLAGQPGLLAATDFAEFGTNRDGSQVGTRYGWLGAEQRAGDTPSGVFLMGVRLYNPVLGRFVSVDPIYGGSANPYEYCSADPNQCVDIAGKGYCRIRWLVCGKVANYGRKTIYVIDYWPPAWGARGKPVWGGYTSRYWYMDTDAYKAPCWTYVFGWARSPNYWVKIPDTAINHYVWVGCW